MVARCALNIQPNALGGTETCYDTILHHPTPYLSVALRPRSTKFGASSTSHSATISDSACDENMTTELRNRLPRRYTSRSEGNVAQSAQA
jgi:hypothetical protein